MKAFITCGRYECCITGNGDLLKCIPSRWLTEENEQITRSDTISIHLEKSTDACNRTFPEGWSTVDIYDIPEIMYVRSGKVIFSLQYAAENEVTVRIPKALDSYIRIGIHYAIMLATHRTCVGLHGVTLLCRQEIIILSASSGTGKTTLAKLLEKYCDAIIINGDFALLSQTEDGIRYEPTPFCGTSGRSLKHRFRVNRVVFLGQAQENRWRELNGREAMRRFMSNVFIPEWDTEMTQAVQENILKCISSVKVNAYDFAPTQEAAEMFFEQVGGRK